MRPPKGPPSPFFQHAFHPVPHRPGSEILASYLFLRVLLVRNMLHHGTQTTVVYRQIEEQVANRSNSAFTLVEIMIVVSIIGTLAVIAIPSFKKARQNSQLNVCLNDLRIYQDALDQYAFPNRQYPDNINDLVTQGYLKHLYECSVGGAYAWSVNNGNQGYHLTCDGQHAPSINHVCIHENQPPTAK
jgi:prepilin-type N-terminal cleavage/methylation domain-containing protein